MLVSILVVAAIAGGAWWAYGSVKDDPVTTADGSPVGSATGAAAPTGPLPEQPVDELRAVCEGRGDPRFDPYQAGVTATSKAPTPGGLPPKVIHPGAEVHSQVIGAFEAEGSAVNQMWNSYDAAEWKGLQLVACIAQLDAAQLVDCEQGGRQYPAANFRLTLRVTSTGAELTTFDFFSGASDTCYHGAELQLGPTGLTSPNVYDPAALSKSWVEPGA